ncbi:hypothetical protein DM01DRAFT_1341774 [Hesseltinella vesiculosa]|uniref:Membrane magnesium transporter n=1 Tax=Hesseltinella vesiculosa TaxID=101127 RepID=A0A1X2GUY1_9FUNG|nr:hypothetical protein DM01DRAFT_1341774 [Hesseltinella vesiculosa]
MSQQVLGKAIGMIGALFLLHSAFSTYEHLAYLKAVGLGKEEIPIEIVVECLASALVTLVGVVLSAQPFKNILMQEEIKKLTIDKVDTRASFMTFDHRHIHSTAAQQERKV